MNAVARVVADRRGIVAVVVTVAAMAITETTITTLLFSCSAARLGGYSLNEKDAAAAVRQMLEAGTREGVTGAFSKDAVMSTLFPEPVKKALNTLQQLGLTNEVDRFTTTLSTA